MAHFYGTTIGNRGPTSRTGSKRSGLTSTANSYSIGGEVHVHHNKTDSVSFSLTKGSGTFSTHLLTINVDSDNNLYISHEEMDELYKILKPLCR